MVRPRVPRGRDAVYSLPLFCTFYWFAHDTSYLVRFDKWFVEYEHWFTMLWWVAFVPAVLFEVVFLVQSARLARNEQLRGWSARAAAGLMVAGAAVGWIVWEAVKSVFDDDLYLLGFGLTIVSYPVFGFALLLRRRSAEGQTTGMWLSFLITAVGYFTVSITVFGDAFRSWQWFALAAVSVLGGAGMLALVRAMRRGGLAGPRLAPALQEAAA